MSCAVHAQLPAAASRLPSASTAWPSRATRSCAKCSTIRRPSRSRPGSRRRARWSSASCCCRRRAASPSRRSRSATTKGRRETDEEAMIRALIEREVAVPRAGRRDLPALLREQPRAFPLARHLRGRAYPVRGAARRRDAYAQARDDAAAVLAELREHPERFADAGRAAFALSVGGAGRQSRPDHDRADHARVRAGAASRSRPVSCARRRSRRATASTSSGSTASMTASMLPFELVADRIADYLRESVRRRADAQYIARLVSAAKIEGVELAGAEALRVHWQEGIDDHAAR